MFNLYYNRRYPIHRCIRNDSLFSVQSGTCIPRNFCGDGPWSCVDYPRPSAEPPGHIWSCHAIRVGSAIHFSQISFIKAGSSGALHWGMEFAGYGGHKGYRRLFLGMAPMLIAWPTLGMQPMTALIVQWVGFTGLWYADSKVTMLGWGKSPQF